MCGRIREPMQSQHNCKALYFKHSYLSLKYLKQNTTKLKQSTEKHSCISCLEEFILLSFKYHIAWTQGVTRLDGARGIEASLAPPCLNLGSFGSKCTVLKKVLVTLLELFYAPRSDSLPRELHPFAHPCYAPAWIAVQ